MAAMRVMSAVKMHERSADNAVVCSATAGRAASASKLGVWIGLP